MLRSDRELRQNEWVTVTAHHDAKESQLTVNGDEPVRDYYRGRNLNLRTPLFIGGYDRERVRVSPHTGVDSGFHGCISKVRS